MYQSRMSTEELKKAYPHLLEPIKLKPAPPDPTIPEIMVAPAPYCPKCDERMILKRPFHDERFYREYWRCLTKRCKSKIQIDDDGYPIIEQKGEQNQNERRRKAEKISDGYSRNTRTTIGDLPPEDSETPGRTQARFDI